MHDLRMRRILLFALTIGMSLSGIMAQVPEGISERRWWNAPRIVERLRLTEEQQAKIEAAAEVAALEKIDLEAVRKKAELRVARLLDAKTLDEAAVRKAVEEIADARCAIMRAEMKSRYEIALLLDSEQRREIKKLFLGAKRQREPGERRRPNRPPRRP